MSAAHSGSWFAEIVPFIQTFTQMRQESFVEVADDLAAGETPDWNNHRVPLPSWCRSTEILRQVKEKSEVPQGTKN